MRKLDESLTAAMQLWLNTPAEERNIEEGAMMLLKVNRNRAFYNSVIMRPEKYAAKLEYELRKHLNIRMHKMSVADVVSLEQEVMPRVEKTIEAAVITVEAKSQQGEKHGGMRADHNELPAEIQALWGDNAERYHTMKQLFEELKAMSDCDPCDRFEKLVILDKVETVYRNALADYDAYDVDNPQANPTADKKRISALRKAISERRKKLSTLEDDADERASLVEKLQSAVDELLSLGAGLSPDTRVDLEAAGIKI